MYPLNRYSKALIGVYLPALFIMEYGAAFRNWTEGIILTIPLIGFFIFWSERMNGRLNYRKPVSGIDGFYRDVFIINYATLFAFIASLLLERNNVDARGWWPLLIIMSELYGIVFGTVFAVFALLLNRQHFRYTLIFALILLINFSTLKFMPYYINLKLLGPVHIFPACVLLLLSIHLLICFGYQIHKGISESIGI